MMTGRFPEKPACGRQMNPEIVLPSKLFQRISSGSGSFSRSSPPLMLFAHRSPSPVFTFSEYTAFGARGDLKLKARSVELLCHLRSEMTPAGRSPVGLKL